MTYKIPFNKPFLTGRELIYINDAIQTGKISGNGKFTGLCHDFFRNKYGFKKCLLTTSCTDALEMSAILINTSPGDEIILPSYTFVSTANAFVLRGAKLVFCDSLNTEPDIDAGKIESLITARTKAIVVVHYAGVSCDMDKIMVIAEKHNLFVIEDVAQGIDSFYNNKPLGSIGHLSCFSFHETKNIMSGEGGMLVINSNSFFERAEIIWEKGTNRASFYRGEVDKYGWVDIGSSYLPSEIIAAFLYAQLENLPSIQKKRLLLWNTYHKELKELENSGDIKLPHFPDYSTNNAHMFYIICKDLTCRTQLIEYLKKNSVYAVFHYLPLHLSPFYFSNNDGRELPQSIRYSECLVRLPMFYELSTEEVSWICELIRVFFRKQ